MDNPPGVPLPAGNYSHVARLDLGAGLLLVVSGQLALDEDGALIGEDNIAAQSERVFEILGAILSAHGASFAEVIHLRTYVTDMRRIDEYASVRARHMPDPPPTSTTVEVSRLVLPGALVEVELMAAIPTGSE
jgi:2-iminobutanoate/2-iminopropanoate deaminase